MKRFGWQVVGCSVPAMQRQERCGRQELIAAPVADPGFLEKGAGWRVAKGHEKGWVWGGGVPSPLGGVWGGAKNLDAKYIACERAFVHYGSTMFH